MKVTTIFCLIFCCSVSIFAKDNLVGTEGIQFFNGSWAEAKEESKRTGKLIFVDAYTSWCGPCKKMARDIFPQKEVGDFYNANFVNMKIDMEKGEGRTIRAKYNVNAFPTFLFVDADGKLQFSSKGGKPADRFIKMGQTALSKVDYTGQYVSKYEDGDRDPELLYNYAYALMKSNKPSVKVANEYLKTQEDLSLERNLNFLLDLSTEADSRLFDLMIQNRKAIEATRDPALVKDKIEKACRNTVKKAIEFQSADLLSEAKKIMSKQYPEKATRFAYDSDIEFALGTQNGAAFAKSADKFLKKTAKKNAAENNRMAKEALRSFKGNKTVMAKALKWAAVASEYGGLYKYHMTYANLLYENGKMAEAKKIAELALEMGTKEKLNTRDAQALIKKIK